MIRKGKPGITLSSGCKSAIVCTMQQLGIAQCCFKMEEAKKKFGWMLSEGIIRHSTSPFSAHLFL